MKKMLGLMAIALLAITSGVNAQIRKIPSEVTVAFHAKYPDAKNESWGDKITAFEASFNLNGVDCKATFASNGDWKSSEKTIAQAELPGVVKDGFAKSKYGEWEVKSVTFLQTKDKPDQYRIFVDRATLNKRYLYFTLQGKLTKDAVTL
jgi:hypothetical protein